MSAASARPSPRFAAGLFAAAGLVLALGAQEPVPARPRIGLVLSGGGARGIAHAGVLQVLEELRVPVDCVVGTSMGAIVGGLYAYGLSPAQLQGSLMREGLPNDWSYLLRDGPRREDLSFRRKEDERQFMSDIRIGVRDGAFAFPKGLLQGQNLEIELRCLTLEAHDLRSFDELPLPFRCVAVDIGNGEQVVLGSGSLPEAMRASMSLPGIFAPVRIDGRELIDGGLLNNVPVDVARALGVDVLIVVDIGTPLDKDRKVKNLFDVTGQMVAILTEQNVRVSRASLRPEDVFIVPELGDITSADFQRAAESIALGAAATRGVAERLRRFSVSEADYAQYLRKQRRVPKPMPEIRSLEFVSDSALGKPLLEDRVGVRAGTKLDEGQLRAGCELLYGTDDLERVNFTIHDWRDGAADLTVNAEEKSWGPSYMRFGLGLESNYEGESSFDLRMQFNKRTVDSLGAEWRSTLQIGKDNEITTEYYQPLDAGGVWFVAPRLTGESFQANLFQQGQKIAEVAVQDVAAGFDVGAAFGQWAELRAGLEWAWGDTDVRQSVQPLTDLRFADAVARVLFQVDTLDNPRFPNRGSLGKLEWRVGLPELGADNHYQQLEAAWLQAFPIGAETAIVPKVSFVTALEDVTPIYAEPTIGGFLNLSGFLRDAFRDQHTGLLALIAHHRFAGSASPLGFPVYLGGSVEAGNAWSTRADFAGEYTMAGSVFVGVDTPLGPSFIAYGQAEGGERTAYFFLGTFY